MYKFQEKTDDTKTTNYPQNTKYVKLDENNNNNNNKCPYSDDPTN